ncbi:MAG: type IV toxin-antitoxin system AbiEi family antitoxin [Desulfobaccales bacterium]
MTRNQGTREDLIKGCLETLKKLDCCDVEFIPPEGGESHDGMVRLVRSGEQLEYTIEIKQQLTKTKAGILLHLLRRVELNTPLLIFTDYIHIELAQYFRENRIEFVDVAGNAYLNRPPLFIFVVGQKRALVLEKPTRAFQATGLKIIFFFLKKPEAVNWNYREIAEATDTALGGISWIVSDLRRLGFVRLKAGQQRKRQRELNNSKELIDRWELGYSEKLRPRLFRNRYRIASEKGFDGLIEGIQHTNYSKDILLGGELGAALLLKTLRPQSATLHLLGDALKLITALKLIPDPSGRVTVLDGLSPITRWEEKEIEGCTLADPLLIHAELLLKGSERLSEVAKDIYDQILAKRLEKTDDYAA